jgi:glucose-6-phosphate dehydrogenase assembly protein OpcA
MTLRLEGTNAGAVAAAIAAERHRRGASATGMAMTLVVVADEESQADATQAAAYSAGEHPCRILTVIARPGRGAPRLDAGISVGDSEGPGEMVRLRLRNSLAEHPESVVLPLLLSDTPVVAWWPAGHPADLADDPIGKLATRRIVDSTVAPDFAADLIERKTHLAAGDTDLTWTRLTPWRAALAATLDQPYDPIVAAEIHSEPIPATPLMRTWLEWRLGVPVTYVESDGPAINRIVLQLTSGEIAITRPTGHMAVVKRNGVAVKQLYLPQREVKDLISEELRRLDPDETYEETMRRLDVARLQPDANSPTAAHADTDLCAEGSGV